MTVAYSCTGAATSHAGMHLLRFSRGTHTHSGFLFQTVQYESCLAHQVRFLQSVHFLLPGRVAPCLGAAFALLQQDQIHPKHPAFLVRILQDFNFCRGCTTYKTVFCVPDSAQHVSSLFHHDSSFLSSLHPLHSCRLTYHRKTSLKLADSSLFFSIFTLNMASNHSPSYSEDFVMLESHQIHDLPLRQRPFGDEAERDHDFESSSSDDDLEHISRPGSVRSLNTPSPSSSPLLVPVTEGDSTAVSSLTLQASSSLPQPPQTSEGQHQAEHDLPAHSTLR